MTDTIIDRRYTVEEIDRMRELVGEIAVCTPGFLMKPRGSRAWNTRRDVRTYMLAGIRPEELETRLKKLKAARRWFSQSAEKAK